MRFCVFLLSLCAFCFAVAIDFLSEDGNDSRIFLDSNDELSAEPFIPQDSTFLSAIPEESSPEQDSQLDYSNFAISDQTNPLELAEADNLCAADEAVQYLGKMRARKEQTLCNPSDSNTNLLDQPKLELPNLFDLFRPKKPKLGAEPAAPPLFEEDEGLLQVDDVCDSMHRVHLCCLEPAPDSFYSSYGMDLYNTMLGCRTGTAKLSYMFPIPTNQKCSLFRWSLPDGGMGCLLQRTFGMGNPYSILCYFYRDLTHISTYSLVGPLPISTEELLAM